MCFIIVFGVLVYLFTWCLGDRFVLVIVFISILPYCSVGNCLWLVRYC